MNRKTKRMIIEEIRERHDNKKFYKIDKVLKLSKIKILEIKDTNKEDVSRVTYKYGLNLFNPITWIIIIIPGILIAAFNGAKEITDELQLSQYTDDIIDSIINDTKNKM